MTSMRMTTRLQSRKDCIAGNKGNVSSPGKRKQTSSNLTVEDNGVVEDENNTLSGLHPSKSGDSRSRSFPQAHEGLAKKRNKSSKVRPSLAEREVNTVAAASTSKNAPLVVECNRSVTKTTIKKPQSPPFTSTASIEEPGNTLETPKVESPPLEEDITQDEISKLEEETTVQQDNDSDNKQDMSVDEATSAAALMPLTRSRSSYSEYCPRFYRLYDSIESPMQTDFWHEWNRPRLPRGVVDIDSDNDSLDSSCYSNDINVYLRWKEKRCPLPPYFLDTSPDVTPKMRGVLMDWLIQVQNHESLEEDTLHLCVALIDRYLAVVRTRMPRLQLVGITCLLIATKFLERFAPEISTLCYLTAHSFKPPQVLRHEIQVLATLDFDIGLPLSTSFLNRYLQVHRDLQPQEVSSLANYLLNLTLTSAKMAPVLPSLLAASATYLARRLVLGCSHSWTPSLAHYTSYEPFHLSDTVREMANLLFKAPSSKFQGARTKYNVEEHRFISHSVLTSAETLESRFSPQVSSV